MRPQDNRGGLVANCRLGPEDTFLPTYLVNGLEEVLGKLRIRTVSLFEESVSCKLIKICLIL